MKSKPQTFLNTLQSILENYMPVTESGCWIWLGKPWQGYGRVTYQGVRIRAHRFFYEAHRGEIPNDMCVCHKCDTRICVNPDHLFLGSNVDNTMDKVRKNRQARGNKVGRKLTDSDVYAIRGSSTGTVQLARSFAVSRDIIRRIRNRAIWAHLPELKAQEGGR